MAAEAEAVVPFFEAVLLGVVAEVGRLLDEDGRLVEARVGPGCTPLLLAAGRGRVDVVRLLLERGADIKASDELGNSALHHAVLTSSNEEVVDVLLDWGVDASRAGPRGVTPLMLASSQGKTGAVARVLRALRGQGLNAQAETGATALWGGCNMGHTDTAKVLLLEGADHTIGDHDGVTARMKAEDKGHEECVALIQWWEGELERGYVVHRARYHMEQYSVLKPCLQALAAVPATCPVPAHLRPRLSLPQLPHVETVALAEAQKEQEISSTTMRKDAEQGGEGPCEGEKDATLKYVMHGLAPELYIELMAGFH